MTTIADRGDRRRFAGEVHVYEPHRAGLPPIGSYLKQLWRRREFALELARTNLRAQHYNTVFGQLWMVLNPLLLGLVYFALVEIIGRGNRGIDFLAHLLLALFAFRLVSSSVRQGAKSVVGGGRLILNTAFPRTLLPLSSVLTSFMIFLPTLVVYAVVHAAGGLPVTPQILWTVPIVALLIILAAGMSMLVAAVQVYFRDLSSFLPYALRIWLYSSPILYYAAQVPDKFKPILYVNPLYPLLTSLGDAVNLGREPRRLSCLQASAGRSGCSSSEACSSSRGSVSSLSASRGSVAELTVPRAPDTDFAVKVDNLVMTYRTTIQKRPTLKRTLVRLGRRKRLVRTIEAVRDVSFEVPHGSVLGIIGVNGAGKSTLMRTVAGILPPTSGRVEVHGRVSTLLALGVGFKSSLTGRDNVVLGGLAAGLTREQLAAKYDEIAEFAELGDFMDLPMRTYSSGMFGRLAFSVAVNMEPDILLIDEALSVGDARFKQKSFDKMRELCDEAGTILIVSHALMSIRELCNEVLWMDKGKVAMRGDPDTVIEAYKEFLNVRESDVAEEDV